MYLQSCEFESGSRPLLHDIPLFHIFPHCFPVFTVPMKQKCLKMTLIEKCNNEKNYIKYFQTSDDKYKLLIVCKISATHLLMS